MTDTMKIKALRFRKQDSDHLVGILEWYEAAYGDLLFQVKRYPVPYKYYPGPGVHAIVSLGFVDDPEHRHRCKTIADGKLWCRSALCWILRGQALFGVDAP